MPGVGALPFVAKSLSLVETRSSLVGTRFFVVGEVALTGAADAEAAHCQAELALLMPWYMYPHRGG